MTAENALIIKNTKGRTYTRLNLPSKATAIGLVSILLLQMIGFVAIPTAAAQERYTSLTYNGQINLSFEEDWSKAGYTAPGKAQLTFTLTLDRPFGVNNNELSGNVVVQGTLSGTTTDARPFTGCSGSYQVTGTFTTTINAVTSFQTGTIDLSGGGVRNYVGTTSPVIQPGYGCFGGGFEGTLNSILISAFSSSTQQTVTNRGWDKFPIQGGTQTLAKGSSEGYKSISGTATLTLVDSKKAESFDFSVDVTPPEVKVFKGGTGTYNVSVSTISGKAAQVTLSAPNIEGLGRLALDRTTGTPPFNAKLTVAAGEAKPGKYTFQITGTAGDLSKKTKTVTLVVEDCPIFTIAPTIPAANDPREFASPNGKASFRFDIEWGGKLPVSIGLNAVAAGGGVVQPSFAFNPVQMLNGKVNVIMEVTTKNAGKGNYPIIVTATVNDPELPNSCSTAAPITVTLVVGDSRAQDFPLIIRPIQIVNQQGKVAVQGKQVETQNDGKAKVAITNGTIDIGSNTKINIVRPNRTAEHQNRTTGPLINDILDPELDKEITNELREKSLRILEEAEKDRQRAAAQKDLIDFLACIFAFDPEIARSCLNYDVVYVDHGEVHVFDLSKEKRLQDIEMGNLVILAPDAVIIPKGTEFTLKLDSNGNTVLTMIDGSVLYTQLSTQNTILVNATQQLTAEVQQAGGGQSISDSVSSINPNNIERWWLQENTTTTSTTTNTTTTTTTTTTVNNSTKTSSSTTSTTITSSTTTTQSTTTTTSTPTSTTSTSSTTTSTVTSTQIESTGTTASQEMDFSVIGAVAVFAVVIVGIVIAVRKFRRTNPT